MIIFFKIDMKAIFAKLVTDKKYTYGYIVNVNYDQEYDTHYIYPYMPNRKGSRSMIDCLEITHKGGFELRKELTDKYNFEFKDFSYPQFLSRDQMDGIINSCLVMNNPENKDLDFTNPFNLYKCYKDKEKNDFYIPEKYNTDSKTFKTGNNCLRTVKIMQTDKYLDATTIEELKAKYSDKDEKLPCSYYKSLKSFLEYKEKRTNDNKKLNLHYCMYNNRYLNLHDEDNKCDFVDYHIACDDFTNKEFLNRYYNAIYKYKIYSKLN